MVVAPETSCPKPASRPVSNAGTRKAVYPVSGSRRLGQSRREMTLPGDAVAASASGASPLIWVCAQFQESDRS